MAEFLLSYDLKTVRPRVRPKVNAALESRGWRTVDKMDDGRQGRLPNTVMIGTFDGVAEAQNSFRTAINLASLDGSQRVEVTKVIITSYSRVTFSSDDVKKEGHGDES